MFKRLHIDLARSDKTEGFRQEVVVRTNQDISLPNGKRGNTHASCIGQRLFLHGTIRPHSITPSKEWLARKVYTQDASGNRKEISVLSSSRYNQYYDYRDTARSLYTYIPVNELGQDRGRPFYLGLSVNEELFADPQYANMKVYAGQFATAEEAMAGRDITEKILATDMTQQNAGYLCGNDQSVTIY